MSPNTTTSEEDVALLQKRLSLFGLVGSVFSVLGLVLAIVPFFFSHDIETPIAAFALQAIGGLIVSAVWLYTRKGSRNARALRVAEATCVLTALVCFHAMATQLPPFTRPDLIATLITLQVLALRAVLIPSTARWTAVLSTLGALPLLVVAHVVSRGLATQPAAQRLPAGELEVMALLWILLSVGTSTVTSGTIYGLRRAVRKAMELGQYTLLEKIGAGGMGQVYRARHAMLRRPTAVKLLDAGKAADLVRFEREVQLTAQLTHPNTITVFDYGKTPDGVFYYAMELLDGADLQKLVEANGPMPPARVVHILAQVADALAEAHGVGLIHRDIKPGNIILSTRGTSHDVAKVVDFGLVKSPEKMEGDDAVMGTPLYMAPETITNPGSIDARTDIYALGAVGYFLLTATPVFVATSLPAILSDHVHTSPVPPTTRLGKDVPKDLEDLLLMCLAKSPADRPATALSLRDRLRACAAAGTWTEEQARAAWTKAPTAKTDGASWSATTLAVDIEQRSPKAVTLAP